MRNTARSSSGAVWFVDMHMTMDGNLSLSESHAMMEKIERKVRSILPKSDVTVHVEPLEMKGTQRFAIYRRVTSDLAAGPVSRTGANPDDDPPEV